MGSISSVADSTIGAGWRAVKNTVKGAMDGNLGDIAKIAVVAGVATGAIPANTGALTLAGDEVIGTLFDKFA